MVKLKFSYLSVLGLIITGCIPAGTHSNSEQMQISDTIDNADPYKNAIDDVYLCWSDTIKPNEHGSTHKPVILGKSSKADSLIIYAGPYGDTPCYTIKIGGAAGSYIKEESRPYGRSVAEMGPDYSEIKYVDSSTEREILSLIYDLFITQTTTIVTESQPETDIIQTGSPLCIMIKIYNGSIVTYHRVLVKEIHNWKRRKYSGKLKRLKTIVMDYFNNWILE